MIPNWLSHIPRRCRVHAVASPGGRRQDREGTGESNSDIAIHSGRRRRVLHHRRWSQCRRGEHAEGERSSWRSPYTYLIKKCVDREIVHVVHDREGTWSAQRAQSGEQQGHQQHRHVWLVLPGPCTVHGCARRAIPPPQAVQMFKVGRDPSWWILAICDLNKLCS